MNKYTCMIVDDEPQAVELLADIVNTYYKNMEVLHTYTLWSKALDGLRNTPCDVLFLDISMQGKSGLDLLKSLPDLKSEVVFITAHSDHALEAFKLSATGYILKPVDEAEFVKTVDKVLERVQHKRSAGKGAAQPGQVQHKIGIPGNNAIDYINIDDIVYLEALSSYTNVFTGVKKIISSYNLQKFKHILDHQLFFQVHRSYIVNLNHVRRYENIGMLIMANNAEIPVSKNFRDDFLNLFGRVRNESARK
jgi:two-component system, LytTR family, response regulator